MNRSRTCRRLALIAGLGCACSRPAPQPLSEADRFHQAADEFRQSRQLLTERRLEESSKAFLHSMHALEDLCGRDRDGGRLNQGPYLDGLRVREWYVQYIGTYHQDTQDDFDSFLNAVTDGKLEWIRVYQFLKDVDSPALMRWRGTGDADGKELAHLQGTWVVSCEQREVCTPELAEIFARWVGEPVAIRTQLGAYERGTADGVITVSWFEEPPPPHGPLWMPHPVSHLRINPIVEVVATPTRVSPQWSVVRFRRSAAGVTKSEDPLAREELQHSIRAAIQDGIPPPAWITSGKLSPGVQGFVWDNVSSAEEFPFVVDHSAALDPHDLQALEKAGVHVDPDTMHLRASPGNLKALALLPQVTAIRCDVPDYEEPAQTSCMSPSPCDGIAMATQYRECWREAWLVMADALNAEQEARLQLLGAVEVAPAVDNAACSLRNDPGLRRVSDPLCTLYKVRAPVAQLPAINQLPFVRELADAELRGESRALVKAPEGQRVGPARPR